MTKKRAPPQLSPEERERVLRDIQRKGGDRTALLARSWIQETKYFAERVAAGIAKSTPECRTVFWVRVYGVFSDIHDHVAQQLEFTRELLANHGGPRDAKLSATYLPPQERLLTAILGARAVLSADDLTYLEYRRHTECHPWQHGYRLRVTKDGLVDTRPVFGRVLKIDDVDAAIDRVLIKHRLSEKAIAVDFAGRLLPGLSEVFGASEAWYGARAP